jgi:hypothetical protein
MNRWRVRLAELQNDTSAAPAHVQNVQNVQKATAVPPSEHFEHIEQPEPIPATQHGTADAEAERAAIIEYDGGAPRAWAEALARLDPANPPGDVPPVRWTQLIDDCGRFLDHGWAQRCAALG